MSARTSAVVVLAVSLGFAAFAMLNRFVASGSRKVAAVYARDAALVAAPAQPEVDESKSMAIRDAAGCFDLIVKPHHMVDGADVVIAVYRLEDARVLTYDDESFRFLSIRMRRQEVGRRLLLPVEGVEVRFSRGGQYHFLRCEAEIGMEPRGWIATTAHADGRMTVAVDIEMTVVDAKGIREARDVRIQDEFDAVRVMATTGPAILSQSFLSFH